MANSVDDQVVEFYYDLFEGVFWNNLKTQIDDLRRRRAVRRALEESADASSQSLSRFLLNRRVDSQEVGEMLGALARLAQWLELEAITNPNTTPETLAERFHSEMQGPTVVQGTEFEATYRVALDLVVQTLALVGPVISEWQKINFSGEFELLDRVVDRLNAITSEMSTMAGSAQDVEDERFELSYRDYLLQRFFHVEAGTVRMTTNVNVDLRELFVMPRVLPRPIPKVGEAIDDDSVAELMDLVEARKVFQASGVPGDEEKQQENATIAALDHVLGNLRTVIVGTPGSGKSTFMEWLQLRISNAEEEFILGGQQAIPLLLRVRQLDAKNLPREIALIEKATASKDRARLMPVGWMERQLKAGRVLLMVDGLDETEPDLRDHYLLPWLEELCTQYTDCAYVVSSRPAGYSPRRLRKLKFVECDLTDFNRPQIEEYCQHWCTSVRLAQNEPEEEARREGHAEGEKIVAGFERHGCIRDLARNPLMLSAICLVNYFERGQLPKDSAKLYELCVEGLLHHWDKRRGIHSEFALGEKLGVCREVAVAMQANNLAEYDESAIREVFEEVLGESERAGQLLKHVRYRTGLLVERRAGVYAFAHLTFQEYLAACAVVEGNHSEIDLQHLIDNHVEPRWTEVIPLFFGMAPAPIARQVVELLLQQDDSEALTAILAESILMAPADVAEDQTFRRCVLERIASGPGMSELFHFSPEEIAPIANRCLGTIRVEGDVISPAYVWLVLLRSDCIDPEVICERLKGWAHLTGRQMWELFHAIHAFGDMPRLNELAQDQGMYEARLTGTDFHCAAEVALLAVLSRNRPNDSRENCNLTNALPLFRTVLRALANAGDIGRGFRISVPLSFSNDREFERLPTAKPGMEVTRTGEILDLLQTLARRYKQVDHTLGQIFAAWASRLKASLSGTENER